MKQRAHLLHAVETTFEQQCSGKKGEFSTFVYEKRKKLEKLEGQRVSTRDLSNRIGIKYELFRKIINMQKPTKNRDFVIALCAVLQIDSAETNTALTLYDNMPPLNTEYPRDDLLIEILEEQLEAPLSIESINQRLIRNNYPPLDCVDRRGGNTEDRVQYPYTLLKKRVECHTDNLYYGDPYDSLQTAFQPDRYDVVAEMWLTDEVNKRGYKLTADTANRYMREDYPFREKSIHLYHDLNETEEFRDCFIELKSMAMSELKTMANYLRDTRNYRERKSAGIIDNHLHVYYETYNYAVPEFGEYYLMDYSDGVFTLSVSKESRFMQLYLSNGVYASLYGKAESSTIEEYSSVEEIKLYYSDKHKDEMLMKLRISAYKKMKAEMEIFIQKLKDKEIHMRNYDQIFDERYAVLQFYRVADAFDCEYDEEGFITNVRKEYVEFRTVTENKIQLSVADLEKAFELGLDTIDEIAAFLSQSGTLEISELL